LQERFTPTEKIGKRHQVPLVRYADDVIITGRTKALLAEEVTPVVERFLAERGFA
jgi:RNA-directed DNA polymerase